VKGFGFRVIFNQAEKLALEVKGSVNVGHFSWRRRLVKGEGFFSGEDFDNSFFVNNISPA